uniref:EF-hand domain family member D2 n=2 Tax=Canidae TaxID=9608 RepID=A0A8C0JTH4_CANLU
MGPPAFPPRSRGASTTSAAPRPRRAPRRGLMSATGVAAGCAPSGRGCGAGARAGGGAGRGGGRTGRGARGARGAGRTGGARGALRGRGARGGAGRGGARAGPRSHPRGRRRARGVSGRGRARPEAVRARGEQGPGRASAARATMATDELASKLSRRLQLEDEGGAEAPEQPGLNGAAAAAAAGAPDEAAEALGSADGELSAKLLRRADLNQGIGEPQSPSRRVFNPYTEFKEFSRKQIKDMEKMFKQYDAGRDGFIDLMELKLMMEKLGAPQTHLGLKNMIKEVDEDFDSKLSFREFLLIFRKAAAGELQEDSGLHVLARLSEIDVSTEGVKGAKSFFEAKVQAINVSSRFEEEIKAEQEERKKQAEEMKQRKAAFKELQSTFK